MIGKPTIVGVQKGNKFPRRLGKSHVSRMRRAVIPVIAAVLNAMPPILASKPLDNLLSGTAGPILHDDHFPVGIRLTSHGSERSADKLLATVRRNYDGNQVRNCRRGKRQ